LIKNNFYFNFASTEILEEPTEEEVLWLRQNDAPEEEVELKWTSSFKVRPKCDNVAFYFQSYKCLRSDKIGHNLVRVILYQYSKINKKTFFFK